MTRASGFWEIGGYAKNHPVRLRLPPLHRRGIAGCRYGTTTPSGCACHPSTGGELPGADTAQPPRQAAPATPPQEGNDPAPCLYRYEATTPSGCACHPSTGGEWSGTMLIQIRGNHPVRLRLPPLHRRGIAGCRYGTTTLSGCVCHSSTGGELPGADTAQPPRQAAPATPPQEGNVLIQIRGNHPVRLRLPPLHRRGMVWHYTYADTKQPPRQAAPATPPQEGNCRVQIRHNHPIRRSLPPLHRRGMVWHHAYTDTRQPPRQATPATPPQEGNGPAPCLYRYEATTPSGCACHPSTGGECTNADTFSTAPFIHFVYGNREFGGTGQCYCSGPSKNTLTRI